VHWKDVKSQTCSIARALAEVGDRWTLLIVRDAMLGARTFGDFLEGTGAARNILTTRLERLVTAGILRRRQQEQASSRHEYVLTPKGVDLYPVMMTLVRWGNTWHDDGLGKPIEHTHATCGHTFEVAVTCLACGEEALPQDTQPRPGPSYQDDHPFPDAWRFLGSKD
jgi:DNA-binding HxlR family transcriptional regulator